jgi:hypothetical protein
MVSAYLLPVLVEGAPSTWTCTGFTNAENKRPSWVWGDAGRHVQFAKCKLVYLQRWPCNMLSRHGKGVAGECSHTNDSVSQAG